MRNAFVKMGDRQRNQAKTGHLLSLPGAKESLKLFKADLSEEGSFDSAVTGCEGVFHVASPMDFSKDHEDDFIKPAVNGVVNVLSACTKAGTVKRACTKAGTVKRLVYNSFPDIMKCDGEGVYCTRGAATWALAWGVAVSAHSSAKSIQAETRLLEMDRMQAEWCFLKSLTCIPI
eukprot:Gb_09083 [translate_table: standard]